VYWKNSLNQNQHIALYPALNASLKEVRAHTAVLPSPLLPLPPAPPLPLILLLLSVVGARATGPSRPSLEPAAVVDVDIVVVFPPRPRSPPRPPPRRVLVQHSPSWKVADTGMKVSGRVLRSWM